MNTQDINLAIAEIEGLSAWCQVDINGHKVGYVFVDDGYQDKIIDYTKEWNLCGPLMEKLGKAGWKYSYDSVSKKHVWLKEPPTNIWSSMRGENESLLLATCLAFIEEFWKDV